MLQFTGKAVYKGMALGPVIMLKTQGDKVRQSRINDVEAELKAVQAARARAREQLLELYNKALEEVGESVELEQKVAVLSEALRELILSNML